MNNHRRMDGLALAAIGLIVLATGAYLMVAPLIVVGYVVSIVGALLVFSTMA